MRVDFSIPESQRTGLSVYYNDYKRKLSVDCSRLRPTSAFRRNNPHPSQDFLEPRHIPNESEKLHKKVRQAVRNYLNELHQSSLAANANESSQIIRHPDFEFDHEISPTVARPIHTPNHYNRVPPATHLMVVHSNSRPSSPICVNGQSILRPASSVIAERYLEKSSPGETKRDRSLRIKEKIKKENRLATPKPEEKTWQRVKSAYIPSQAKPHWTDHTNKSSKKRITSAPPGVKGYTYYPQARKGAVMEETNDMRSNLEMWSKNASNYEKEVVFNMLKQITPRPADQPSTPISGDFTKMYRNPAAEYHQPGTMHVSASYPNMNTYEQNYHLNRQKQRNVYSAPIKKLGGLVPAATQRPLHDQRLYRLKGQDSRLNPSPGEERELNAYMDQLELSTNAASKLSKKYVSVPMHSYLPRKTSGPQDYQCNVSFFQSVRSPFKKHFIIHPDFTSENLKKRKPVSHTITHFRY